MNILFDYQIFAQQEYGGVSRYYIELKQELEKNKDCFIDIKVLFPQNKYLEKELHRRTFTSKNKYWNLFVELINKVYDLILCIFHKYDIVHLTWNARYLNDVCKGKLVVTIHDMIHELFMKNATIEIRNKKRAIEDSTLIVADSYSTKNDILSIYPYVDEEKIKVVYLGTNHLPLPKKPIGISLPKNYLLYVGKRDGYKNALFYMTCIEKILVNNHNLYFIFAGGGSWSKEEQDFVDKFGDRILQLQVSDAELAYLYQNAIAFVYPSLYEGFGLPILEAFDNQCPVICSNTSSLPEVGGDAALYFAPTAEKELIDQIMKIINNPDLRNEMIKKGVERTKLFTWENTAKEIYEIYKTLSGET